MGGSVNFMPILVAFILALATSILIVLTKQYHGNLSFDKTDGVQKFHTTQTPRIGGIALLVGYITAWAMQSGEVKELLGWIGLAGLPVFAFGLAEDITKKVGVTVRLIASLVAGTVFCLTTGYSVEAVQLWRVDALLAIPFISISFTAFAVGSASNAINIIDGFHGLATGTILIMLSAVGIIAWAIDDLVLFHLTLTITAISAGFFVVNFPLGKIFLGDGGAYSLGFLIAVLSVMLAARNPEVSPWVCPLILSYPLTELVISIVRKSFRKGYHPGQPDGQHLHMLVHRFVVKRVRPASRNEVLSHVLTSLTLWIFPVVSLILVSLSKYEAFFSIRSTIAMFCAYLVLYSALRINEQRSR